MNKLILVFLFILALYAAALAQSNFTDDTFVITTYYPAPYGVYRNMRLQPSDLPSAGVGPGVMYYNQTENMMKFFNNTTWLNMTGGGAGAGETTVIVGVNATCPPGQDIVMKAYGGTWYTVDNPIASWGKVVCGKVLSADGTQLLAYGDHSIKQCTDTKVNGVNGVVFNDSAGWQACLFNAANCPAGSPNWRPYFSWSTTAPKIATVQGCGCPTACTHSTGSHNWNNTGTESDVRTMQYNYTSVCDCSWLIGTTQTCEGSCSLCSCCQIGNPMSSTITQIGCY